MLAGKVVFISGGGGGIGSAAARAFAAAGAKVAVADLLVDRAEAAAASVRDAGGDALAIAMDVTSDDSVAAGVAACFARFGRLDVLYNTAGGTDPEDGPVTEVPLEAFDRTINLDLRGTFLCCRHAIPHIVAAGGGAVINMSSGAALRGANPAHCYSAATGAILSLTRALAVWSRPAKGSGRQRPRCPARWKQLRRRPCPAAPCAAARARAPPRAPACARAAPAAARARAPPPRSSLPGSPRWQRRGASRPGGARRAPPWPPPPAPPAAPRSTPGTRRARGR
jgi:NADP-dependent 3-hydroxy acid dehydrogenase YdfG